MDRKKGGGTIQQETWEELTEINRTIRKLARRERKNYIEEMTKDAKETQQRWQCIKNLKTGYKPKVYENM